MLLKCYTNFLIARRAELIERCRVKVSKRPAPKAVATKRITGIPDFLDQLIETLQAEPARSKKLPGAADSGSKSVVAEMGISATRHGRELSERGYTVEQVIREYGDLCQAITEAALEHGAPIEVAEFRTLNLCLDNATADSVTEWTYHNDLALLDNAFKFTRRKTAVSLRAYAVGDRILIDVEDHCGGLPAGGAPAPLR
jgi:hypothetical protein